jgi:hypothetical protein
MKYVLMLGVMVGAATFVEMSRAQPTPESAEAIATQAITLEGCLRSGEVAGEFAFTVGNDVYSVVPGVGVNLAAHVNHEVQITGIVEKDAKGSELRATAVRMVAAVCAAA